MSKQNKVNPAHYTQRGRLTPDDAAREIARQRSIGSRHTWQPVNRSSIPGLPFKNGDAGGSATGGSAESLEGTESQKASPPGANVSPTKRATKGSGTKNEALTKARRPKAAPAASVGTTTGNAKTPRRAKRAGGTTATRNTRKAVLARNVGGPALKPLREAKGRKR